MIAVLLSVSMPVQAGEGKLDIGPVLQAAREHLSSCSAVTHKGALLTGGCYAPVTWRWGSLNGGLLWQLNSNSGQDKRGIGGGLAAFSVRADKAWDWAWNKSDLGSKGVEIHFVVPRMEFGPTGGWHQATGWFYGGFLNIGWPF